MDRFNLRVIVFSLLVLTPVFAVLFYSGTKQRTTYAEVVEDKIVASISTIALEEENIIEGIKQDLNILSKTSDITTGNIEKCNDLLASVLTANHLYANIGLANMDGDIICSGVLITSGAVNIVDRPYFIDAIKLEGFSNGQFQIGRVTGKPGINFGYPVFDTKGNIKYVLYIALNINWFNDYLQQFSLPEKSTALIIDHDGKIISRSINSLYNIGDTFKDPNLEKIIGSTSSDKVISKQSDGQNNVIYYRGLSADTENPLHLIVMAEEQQITAHIDKVLQQDLILVLLAPLPSMFFGLVFGKRVLKLHSHSPKVNI